MNKRVVYGIMSAVMFISAAILMFYFFWANGYIDPPKTSPTTEYSEFTYPSLPSVIEVSTKQTSGDDNSNKEGDQYSYESPVNFDELKAANSDIVGWIYMTTPYISQPILRSGNDDSYYLSHGANGEYDRNGSLFMEGRYNSADFSDPCTIIYGHRMSDGAMFGNLQASFDDIDIVKNPQYVVIYLPNETKIYHIIATIPCEIKHILYYNNFSNESAYNKFIDKVYATSGSEVQLVTDDRPEYGDKLLILSTCLRTDRTRRFLVIAKELT